jgi:putative endonuclease
MDRRSNRQLGDYGERLACRYLADIGFTILERNWRCVRGEIDIVAVDGDCLVVCEVKTRRSEAFGAPFEAVTRTKARRLRRLAGLWLADTTDRRAHGNDVRIDVVSVLRPSEGPARVEHLRGVA